MSGMGGTGNTIVLPIRALAGRGVPPEGPEHGRGPYWYVLACRTPKVCTAHGLPQVRRISVGARTRPVASRTPARRFGFAANIFSTAAGFSEDAQRAVVVRTRWPVCRACDRRRRGYFTLFLVMLVGALLGWIGAAAVAVTSGPNPALAWPFVACLALALGSVVPFVVGSLPRLMRIHAAPDGSGLIVEDPDPKFVAALAPGGSTRSERGPVTNPS